MKRGEVVAATHDAVSANRESGSFKALLGRQAEEARSIENGNLKSVLVEQCLEMVKTNNNGISADWCYF